MERPMELGTTSTILRVVAQPQPVDHEVFESVLAAECARLAIDFTLEWTENLDRNVNQGDGGRATAELLVTAPGTPDLAWLSSEHDAAPVVRLDLALNEPDRSAGLARHIHGRGIDGLRWAVRAAHYRTLWPGLHLPYGTHLEQFGELRLPVSLSTTADDDESVVAEHRWPLVILLHGGFWRSRWELDLMDAIAIDLAERGLASWNVEYRRPDRHGWSTTVADVAAVLAHVPELASRFPIDEARVAVAGHSAGGQLALQVAADIVGTAAAGSLPTTPPMVVQLAGLVDLVETHRRDLGNGAVPLALGGTPQEIPEVYARASPILRGVVPVDQLVVIGSDDSTDLREMSRRYVRAAGERARLLEEAGDHFAVIDPRSRIWQRTADMIGDELRR